MAQELRIVLRNVGKINPEQVDDYLKAGGYKSLEKARSMQPIKVIEEVKKSGLRGRGGAGFSTGQKWLFTYTVNSDEKYVVCNCDEGEPGTYKDRIILENDPHTLLEGMAICAYAVGAKKGYVYVRGEYPSLVDLLNKAASQAKAKGLLEDFDLEIRMGAGAYVCGEETALIESLEGHRGEPRVRPPYPPVSGLWQKPTIVNNVETFANIAPIIEKGASWFAGVGAQSFPGTKVLTLTGDIKNKTFIEVPTDTKVREVIYDFGGGMEDSKPFKAVQIGGTSGAFMPESQLDTSIDFDSMTQSRRCLRIRRRICIKYRPGYRLMSLIALLDFLNMNLAGNALPAVKAPCACKKSWIRSTAAMVRKKICKHWKNLGALCLFLAYVDWDRQPPLQQLPQ